ncbi:hypothetical protein ACH42_16320 [Endozoicomonas sp. (ex Bugula neritina AB1)]|nr:hypothetical protein ACH42_16320 [Endozoicomonas sp. (ex Bugula neritina AB1)]
MKLLKLFHALFGVLALALTLALANDLVQVAGLTTDINSPAILILLATALCNLTMSVSGFSVRAPKKAIQLLSSLLVITSGGLAALSFYQADLNISGYPAHLIAIMLLISGTVLHFLLNCSPTHTTSNEIPEDSDRETGTVKWFNVTKGFGFITRDLGDDVFVHYRAIRGEGHRTLSEGQRVEFVVVDKDKGLQAEDVIAAPKGR